MRTDFERGLERVAMLHAQGVQEIEIRQILSDEGWVESQIDQLLAANPETAPYTDMSYDMDNES